GGTARLAGRVSTFWDSGQMESVGRPAIARCAGPWGTGKGSSKQLEAPRFQFFAAHQHDRTRGAHQSRPRSLEGKLQSDLPDARIAPASNCAESRSIHRRRRTVQIHAVRSVKELRAELQAPAFLDRKMFGDSHVPVE